MKPIIAEEIRAVPFASAPLHKLLGPLVALKTEAERCGLLAVGGLVQHVDHPVLGSLLSRAVDGMTLGELAAAGLEASIGKSADEQARILLFTQFAVLLQGNMDTAKAELQHFIDSSSPCRSLADTLIRAYMPLHQERLHGREAVLQEILDKAYTTDAHSLYRGGLLAVEASDPGEAAELLDRFRAAYQSIHPFQWAFQDYLSTPEVERCGVEGLLGVLRFGFLAEASIPASFRLLSYVRDTGRAGAFIYFLLGMLYLYREEAVPYDPEKAFSLFSESADRGSALGAEWKARFLTAREIPAFPGNAVPRFVRGNEVFSSGEIGLLLSAFGSPAEGAMPTVSAWYDPDRAAAALLGPAPGWSVSCLRVRAIQAAAVGKAFEARDYLLRGAVVVNPWALGTVVGAWCDSAKGLFAPREDGDPCGYILPPGPAATALRTAIRDDKRFRPMLVLAAGSPWWREELAGLADRLEAEARPQKDADLAALLRRELERHHTQTRSGSGEMTQAEIDELLGCNGESHSS